MHGGQSLLASYALRLIAICPSTSYVERLHKIFKFHRSKVRNKLGYERNSGISFINARMIEESWQLKGEDGRTWSYLCRYAKEFFTITDEEEKYLEAMQTASESMSIEPEDELIGTGDGDADAVNGSAIVDAAQPEAPAEHVDEAPRTSRTGRVLTRRQWTDMVNLDDDV